VINDRQHAAIMLIAAGKKYTEVEKEVGVSHSQLHLWRKDPVFISRLEQERATWHEARRDKLWRVADRSMDVVLEMLDEGDPKTAMDVLRLVAPGLTDIDRASIDSADVSGSDTPVLNERPLNVCGTCGKACRSPGALGSHRRSHKNK
jgi:hypothetical protein